MIVYPVEYDNCEPWEDNYHCVEELFSTREKAEAFILERNALPRSKDTWSCIIYHCEQLDSDDDDVEIEEFINMVPEGWNVLYMEESQYTIVEMEVK